MKIHIDEDKCTGHGVCEGLAPDIFEIRGDLAYLLVEDVPESMRSIMQDSVDQCPVEALRIED